MSQAANDRNLAELGLQIAQRFGFLDVSWVQAQPGNDVDFNDFRNEKDRFNLWARSLGLYQQGHASLDYRFRDAIYLQSHAQNLLQDLSLALQQCEY
jgi:hypothetical protein